jgi:hypothetical protein
LAKVYAPCCSGHGARRRRRHGEKDLSGLRLDAKGHERLEEIRDVVEAALDKVALYCDENDIDLSTIGGVNVGYAGLMSRQSFNTGDKSVSRVLQHYFGGMQSMNSAAIAILYESGIFSTLSSTSTSSRQLPPT